MYKAQGTYQIEDLSLADFTFVVDDLFLNLTNSTSKIGVLYNGWQHRHVDVEGILSPQQAIDHIKSLYSHEVIQEQQASSVTVIQTTNRNKLEARRAFGNEIVNDFLTMRLENPTNLEEDVALSTVLMPIALSLQLGSLGLALGQISQLLPMAGLNMQFVGQKVIQIQNYISNESN
jgi:hypothetical protein